MPEECEHKDVWSMEIRGGHHVILCLDCRSLIHWCNHNDIEQEVDA